MRQYRKFTKKLIIESDGLSQQKNFDSSGSESYIKNDDATAKPVSMNAKAIWGVLVGKLRQLNMMALYVSCGEIRDVLLNGRELTIPVKEDYLYNILSKDENYKKLSEILKQIDSGITLNFIRPRAKDGRAQFNFDKLKELFGEELEYE